MKLIILICVLAFSLADDEFDTFNCLPMPEPGMCKGYFEMYYYDYKTRSCKIFVYGGCGGNLNKFPTEKECMEKCGDVTVSGGESVCDLPSVVGECRAAFPRYYFDKETGICRKFIYGGCGGNGNNFRTEKECNQRCGRLQMESAPPAFCHLEKETGPCRAGFRRFYFNKETGKCEQFLYGGCLGNLNNFPTEQECEAICK